MKWNTTNVILVLAFLASLSTLIYRSQLDAPKPTPLPSQDVTSETLVQVVKQQSGKIIVVNFWATWCDPCREEIPTLLDLAKKYENQLVKIIFVSMDEPDRADKVSQYVSGSPGMVNFRRADEGGKIISTHFADWKGIIPVTLFFSKDGQVLKSIEGVLDYQEFEKIIKELVDH